MNFPIASFGDDLAPIIIGGLFLMIPIVAILTKHQQKMAQILGAQQQQNPQISPIELEQLRNLLHQQSIAIDNLTESQKELARRLDQPTSLSNRLEQSS